MQRYINPLKEQTNNAGCRWTLEDIEALESTIPEILQVHHTFLKALELWNSSWNFYDSCCKDVFLIVFNVRPFPPRVLFPPFLYNRL